MRYTLLALCAFFALWSLTFPVCLPAALLFGWLSGFTWSQWLERQEGIWVRVDDAPGVRRLTRYVEQARGGHE